METRAFLLLVLCVGCGGTADSSSGNRGSGPSVADPLPKDPTEMTVAGAAAEPAERDFGNTQAPPPMLPTLSEEEVAEMACQEGERCADDQPDGDCGSLTLEADVEVIEHPGNVLLVFDRSGSMDDDWNGQRRWQAAGSAIQAALEPLADKFTAGSVFFPSPDDTQTEERCVDPTGITCLFLPDLTVTVGAGTCTVNPIQNTDQIDFRQGPDFLSALVGGNPPLFAPVNGGRTPLSSGLREAQAALANATLEGRTTVVVITDGAPNCDWDPSVEAASMQIVSDWQAQGITTHVIGLPGSNGASDVLNALAQAGGTNTYITPSDSATLQQQLSDIVAETVQVGFDSCVININPPAEVPDKLHLVVTENGVDQDVARELSADAGWTISADGAVAELTGTLCSAAEDGRYESIRFEFGCVDLPPLEPPPPPIVE